MTRGFSETMSELRRKKGASQRTAAADLGISQALLSHYENGAREPGPDYLLGRTDEPGGETAPRLHALAEELRALAARVENAH